MQAVECKEGLPIEADNTSLANINYQSFFGMYAKLAGMTVRTRAQAPACEPAAGTRSHDRTRHGTREASWQTLGRMQTRPSTCLSLLFSQQTCLAFKTTCPAHCQDSSAGFPAPLAALKCTV